MNHPAHILVTNSQSSGAQALYNHNNKQISSNGTGTGNQNQNHTNTFQTPCFDIQESELAYFLEGEFPGLADKQAISLKQVGPQTLMIEARIDRFDPDAYWALCGPPVPSLPGAEAVKRGSEYEKSDTDLTHWILADDNVQAEPGCYPIIYRNRNSNKTFFKARVDEIISERRLGRLQRSFTFTDPVDFDQMKANFAHGLLRIMLKKSQKTLEEDRQFVIGDNVLKPLEAQSCFEGCEEW